MKLDYWILWFEDTPSWLTPMVESLEMDLDDLGFRLRVKNCSSGKDLATLAVDPKYDLILMDYSLKKIDGKDVSGDELIRQIRTDHDVFTEVVFYSVRSADELRDKIYQNGKLDGVYCFNRDAAFRENTLKVIETTVKKVLDTNNMRGIAMASVANCDQLVINSVVERWAQLDGAEKTSIKDKAIAKLETNHTKLAETLETLKTTDDLREILENHSYPSETRFHLLNSITKAKRSCADIGPVRTELQAFPELLQHRNRLGHAKAIEDGDQTVFEGHDNIIYDAEKFRDLRKTMISHEFNLEKLHTLIKERKLD